MTTFQRDPRPGSSPPLEGDLAGSGNGEGGAVIFEANRTKVLFLLLLFFGVLEGKFGICVEGYRSFNLSKVT